jgi:hypothetical protein
LSQITFERVQQLEADLKRATAWADMRSEEVARLEARLTDLGESRAAIERVKAVPRVRQLLDVYAAGAPEVENGHNVFARVVREKAAPEAFTALRAVLDVHHQHKSNDGTCVGCSEGDDTYDDIPWRCPTVRAITAALEGS